MLKCLFQDDLLVEVIEMQAFPFSRNKLYFSCWKTLHFSFFAEMVPNLPLFESICFRVSPHSICS